MTALSRSRWAAIGAAIAIALGLVGMGTVQLVGAEVSSGERGVFVPLTPVRILDTRDGTGGITGPIGAGGSFELQVTGAGGVPADATGVVVNVTGTAATDLSFITVWPAGEPRPNASNLNLTPGQNLPNLVTVKLGAGGRLSFYNYAGTTHLAADVAGYYVGHNHDDRYYTQAQVDELVGPRGYGQVRVVGIIPGTSFWNMELYGPHPGFISARTPAGGTTCLKPDPNVHSIADVQGGLLTDASGNDTRAYFNGSFGCDADEVRVVQKSNINGALTNQSFNVFVP